MPKRRDTGGHKAPRRPDEPAGPPPEQAEVERAIETIVERLKPKPDKLKSDKFKRGKPDAPASKTPERKAGRLGRLSLVWDRDTGG